MAEIMDLVNYAVEHEGQVKALVAAASETLDMHAEVEATYEKCDCLKDLYRALASFLNKPKK
jgi:hypothetical protein